MKLRPFLAALASVAFMATAQPAHALAPANDTVETATTIDGIPYVRLSNTFGAGTDALETDLATQCGFPDANAGVWYSLTLDRDARLRLDAVNSSYVALLAVTTPENRTPRGCNSSIDVDLVANQRYDILVMDLLGSGGGGLDLNFYEIPPAPTGSYVVTGGSVNRRTGSATVTGTYTCENADPSGMSVAIDVVLSQPTGKRFETTGYGAARFSGETCDGRPQQWSVTVIPDHGKFAGGKATAGVFFDVCGPFGCRPAERISHDVRLS